jgi:hypothetical protein
VGVLTSAVVHFVNHSNSNGTIGHNPTRRIIGKRFARGEDGADRGVVPGRLTGCLFIRTGEREALAT